MCIEVMVTIAEGVEARVGAHRLSHESGLHVVKHRGVLYFDLLPNSCGCTLMAGSPDPHAAMLTLGPGVPLALEKALRLLGREAHRFTFATRWMSQDSKGALRLPLSDLVRIVRENQLESNRQYVIGRPA